LEAQKALALKNRPQAADSVRDGPKTSGKAIDAFRRSNPNKKGVP
jgi:hypothetical protein